MMNIVKSPSLVLEVKITIEEKAVSVFLELHKLIHFHVVFVLLLFL